MRKAILGCVLLVAAVGVAVLMRAGAPGRRLEKYARMLKDDREPESRVKAARALGEMGSAAAPALAAALNDDGRYREGYMGMGPVIFVNRVAAEALIKIGRSATGAILEEFERTNNGEATGLALEALEKIGLEPGGSESQQAIQVLRGHFRCPWADQRIQAIRLYRPLAPDDRSPMGSLIEVLVDERGHKNEQALAGLKEFGGDMVSPLVQALSHHNQTARDGANWALSQLPAEQVVPQLLLLLKDAKGATRAASAKALGAFGSRATEAADALRAMLTDQDAETRVEAAKAMWSIDRRAKECFPVLVEAAHGEHAAARREAEGALKQIGPKDEWAVKDLSLALKDENPRVRLQAATALGQIGPAAKEAVPTLLAALEDQDQAVRLAIARAIAKVEPK